MYSYTKEQKLISEAKHSIDFCISHQQIDGSWSYGTLSFHNWVDSFHTGYNLECISEYMKYSDDRSYDSFVEKGLAYYLRNFFTEDGMPKYFNQSLYPIDLHCPAQLVVTLSRLGLLKKHEIIVNKVLEWSINNMQDKRGFFYYQRGKYFTNKIAYIRWSQAWMLFGLTTYLKNKNEES